MQKQEFGGWFVSSTLASATVCVLTTLAVGCHLQVTDGSGEGGSSALGGSTATGTGGTNATTAGSEFGGAQATGGVAGASAGSSGASTGNTNVEDCSNPDAIPNDDREHAVDFGAGATICVVDSSDSDWFYVDAPDDHRAHVIQLDITESQNSWVTADVIAASDGSNMGQVHFSQRGLRASAFVTVGPGTRTLFDFSGFVENSGTTRIDVSLSTEMDDHEPNNDRASATPITAGTEVAAQLINPYVSQTEQRIADYYQIDVAAGQHTVKVTTVPSDLYPVFQVTDSSGAIINSSSHGANRGAMFNFGFTAASAGTYYLRVENFVDQTLVYAGTKAASYNEQYKFQVD
jgi:hypothetical protein